MPKRNKNKEVIKYLLLKKGKIEGRKKLIKLMFLIDHYDPTVEKLRETPLLGNKYIVYHYGVFCFQVYDDFIDLLKEGKITENEFEIVLSEKDEVLLSEDIKKTIDKIIESFGDLSPSELEKLTLEMIGLDQENKEKYFGEYVIDIIKRNKTISE